MFPKSFFPQTYWPTRYFDKVGAAPPVPSPVTPKGGGGGGAGVRRKSKITYQRLGTTLKQPEVKSRKRQAIGIALALLMMEP